MEWHRKNQSIKTKKRSVDAQIKKASWGNDAKFSISASFYKQSDGNFVEDINLLKFKCGRDLVGIVEFDISSYIGQRSIIQKAMITNSSYVFIDENDRKLIGNDEKFPGAYLEFKIAV